MPSRRRPRAARCRASLLLEHLEHAVRDQEAADDVRHRGEQRDRAQDADRAGILGPRHHQRAHHRDRRDRVRQGHERRVQQARHPTDHAQPDERGQHEDEQHRPVVGHGRSTFPSWVTQVPFVISSLKSSWSLSSFTRWPRKLATFRAYIWLACNGSVAGRFTGPRTVTPRCTTCVPICVSSQLPPVSAARSTITDPGRIPSTAARVTRIGARFPGIAAVVTTTSASLTLWARNSSSRRCWSSDSSLAYPPAPSPSTRSAIARNLAPRLSTCSFTAARTSNAETMAPSRRAVAIACRPATPAPRTRTRAGGSVPAAVTSIGKNFGVVSAARRTAL